MKKLIISLSIIFCTLQIVHSQSGWFQINSPTNKMIYSVYFFNKDTGFIGSDSGKIYKTTNGGYNWDQLEIFTNQNIGLIRFYNYSFGIILCKSTNEIYKTNNSGLNWCPLFNNGTLYVQDISFIDTNNFYVANLYNILKTTNSGLNWVTISFGEYLQLYSVHFINNMTGFVAGALIPSPHYSDRRIWKTVNAGISWYIVNTFFGATYTEISFYDNYIGFTVGTSGYFSKTINGGENWQQLNLGISPHLGSLIIINENKLFACGRWGLYKTLNGGINWQQVQISYEHYSDISFPDSNIGYTVGDFGIIFKTTTGGNPIGIYNIQGSIPYKFNLYQNYPNPFNPVTKIRFDIPHSPLERAGVRLIVYDILGREVSTLVNESLKPGTYEVDFDGSSFASGIYFYSLISEGFTKTNKMILLK